MSFYCPTIDIDTPATTEPSETAFTIEWIGIHIVVDNFWNVIHLFIMLKNSISSFSIMLLGVAFGENLYS